jgi:hypothetical protein
MRPGRLRSTHLGCFAITIAAGSFWSFECGIWNLFGICLGFGAWDFASGGPFYLKPFLQHAPPGDLRPRAGAA